MIDYIVFVDDDFIKGEKGGSFQVDLDTFQSFIGKNPIKTVGGSAPSTLKGLGTFGHDCAIIGRIGNDEDGDGIAA